MLKPPSAEGGFLLQFKEKYHCANKNHLAQTN